MKSNKEQISTYKNTETLSFVQLLRVLIVIRSEVTFKLEGYYHVYIRIYVYIVWYLSSIYILICDTSVKMRRV